VSEPLWRSEFPLRTGEERYVTRRQFSRFLLLTSLGMFVGNLWILVRSWWRGETAYPLRSVAHVSEVPVGGVKLFRYPGPDDPCLLIRTAPETFVAYSQKCTHLSCAVFHAAEAGRLECPCHEGYFSIADGRVLQGPPPRPLPRVLLERRGDDLLAVGLDLGARG
jgi:nitrite reductase/ring-hydroxylating ferredoxin subunit